MDDELEVPLLPLSTLFTLASPCFQFSLLFSPSFLTSSSLFVNVAGWRGLVHPVVANRRQTDRFTPDVQV